MTSKQKAREARKKREERLVTLAVKLRFFGATPEHIKLITSWGIRAAERYAKMYRENAKDAENHVKIKIYMNNLSDTFWGDSKPDSYSGKRGAVVKSTSIYGPQSIKRYS